MLNFNWQEAMWSYPQVWIAQTGVETQKSRREQKLETHEYTEKHFKRLQALVYL